MDGEEEHALLEMDEPKYSYWRYYRRNKANSTAGCRLCGRTIKMGLKSSTGGLMRHLQFVHKNIFREFSAERAGLKRGFRTESKRREEEFAPIVKRRRQKGKPNFVGNDWNLEGHIDNNEDPEISHFVADDHHRDTAPTVPLMHPLVASLNCSLAVLQQFLSENNEAEQCPEQQNNSYNSIDDDDGDNWTEQKQNQSDDDLGTLVDNDISSKMMGNGSGGTRPRRTATKSIRSAGVISDAELIARLEAARARLKEAMDDIDLLSAELSIRQHLGL